MNMITVDFHQHANEDFATVDDKVFNKNTSTKQEGLWTHSNHVMLLCSLSLHHVPVEPSRMLHACVCYF